MRRSSLRERDSDCLREDGMRRRTCAPIAEDHDYLYEEGDSIASWQHYEQSAVENTRELLEDPSRDSIVETDSWYMTSRSLAHKFSVVGNLRKRSVREVDGNGVGADTARGDSVNGDGCGGLTGGDGGGGVTREGGQAAASSHIATVVRVRGGLHGNVRRSLCVQGSNAVVTVAPHGGRPQPARKTWGFTKVLDATATQERVYQETARPVLNSWLDASGDRSGLIIAYGASGSGKTHTISGPESGGDNEGLLPRTLAEIFHTMAKDSDCDAEEGKAAATAQGAGRRVLHMQVAEVYCNVAYDLLCDGDELRARELKVQTDSSGRDRIDGLSSHAVEDLESALEKFRLARSHAETAPTKLNAASSRGHTLWMMELKPVSPKGEGKRAGVSAITNPRLWIVDMAGSERSDRAESDTGEAAHINKDHTALFACLNQMTLNSRFVSFRNRTLTHLLRNMLTRGAGASVATATGGTGGGGGKSASPRRSSCVLVVNVHPGASEYAETHKVLANAALAMNVRPNVEVARPVHAFHGNYGYNGHRAGGQVKRQRVEAGNGRAPGTPAVRSSMAGDGTVVRCSTSRGEGVSLGRESGVQPLISARPSIAGWSARARPGQPPDQQVQDRRKIEELEAHVARLSAEVDSLHAEIDSLDARIDKLNEDNQQAITDARDIGQQRLNLIKDLEAQVEGLYTEKRNWDRSKREETSKQKSVLVEREGKIREAEASLEIKLQLLAESEEQVTYLTNALAQEQLERENEMAKAAAAAEVAAVAIREAEDRAARAEDSSRATAVALSERETEKEGLDRKLRAALDENERLAEELAAAQAAAVGEGSRRGIEQSKRADGECGLADEQSERTDEGGRRAEEECIPADEECTPTDEQSKRAKEDSRCTDEECIPAEVHSKRVNEDDAHTDEESKRVNEDGVHADEESQCIDVESRPAVEVGKVLALGEHAKKEAEGKLVGCAAGEVVPENAFRDTGAQLAAMGSEEIIDVTRSPTSSVNDVSILSPGAINTLNAEAAPVPASHLTAPNPSPSVGISSKLPVPAPRYVRRTRARAAVPPSPRTGKCENVPPIPGSESCPSGAMEDPGKSRRKIVRTLGTGRVLGVQSKPISRLGAAASCSESPVPVGRTTRSTKVLGKEGRSRRCQADEKRTGKENGHNAAGEERKETADVRRPKRKLEKKQVNDHHAEANKKMRQVAPQPAKRKTIKKGATTADAGDEAMTRRGACRSVRSRYKQKLPER